MKKHVSLMCLVTVAWHISVSGSSAAESELPTGSANRPISAVIAEAGGKYGHLLSQSAMSQVSQQMSPGHKILLAGTIGFGAGICLVYCSGEGPFNREKAKWALAMGTGLGLLAAAFTYKLTVP